MRELIVYETWFGIRRRVDRDVAGMVTDEVFFTPLQAKLMQKKLRRQWLNPRNIRIEEPEETQG
jgi:hypothetical protein